MPRSGMNRNGGSSQSFKGPCTFKLLKEAQQKLLLQFAPALEAPGFKEMLPDTAYPALSHNVVGNYLYVLSRFPVAVLEEPLTPREREITLLVGDGHPNKTIAAKLKLKRSTVAFYMRMLFKKLKIGSRVLLARYLIALIGPLEQLIGEGGSRL